MPRKLVLITAFVTVLFHSFAAKSPLPPAYVPIKGDYLWAMRTEVSNFDYLEYLFWLKDNGMKEELALRTPDTANWDRPFAYAAPYVEHYLRHPAYRNYPLVNISYEDAVAYCAWVTDRVNEYLALIPDSDIKKVVVRLPTEAEWEYAARAGSEEQWLYPWGSNDLRRTDKKFSGQLQANFVRGKSDYMGMAGSLSDNADITAPVDSYWPNGFGLYNMAGNVAEMVSEAGVTKGGSWRSGARQLEIGSSQHYESLEEGEPTRGLRAFLEVVEFAPRSPEFKEYSAKDIEEMFIYVPSQKEGEVLRFGLNEVTNALYARFLRSLNEAERNKYAPNDAAWLQYGAPAHWSSYSTQERYSQYPVVNLTHEAAEKFCEWLTKEYAGLDGAEQGVKFRLPTVEEWENAARGGLEMSPYPWGGPYLRNSKGEFLANFNPHDERMLSRLEDGTLDYDYPEGDSSTFIEADGARFTREVAQYTPNGYGLWDVSGNVAEMTKDAGVTKGGSWLSRGYSLQVGVRERNTAPNPMTGFRVVMDTGLDSDL